MKQIRFCKDCNRQVSNQNVSGYCRACSPRHTEIDYSKRIIDYKSRNTPENYNTIYTSNQALNDQGIKKYFSTIFLDYYKLHKLETNEVFFSNQFAYKEFHFSSTLVERGLKLLEQEKAIKYSRKLTYENNEWPTNVYKVNPGVLGRLANETVTPTSFLINHFGERQVKSKLDLTQEEKEIFKPVAFLKGYQSNKEISIDRQLDRIKKFASYYNLKVKDILNYLTTCRRYGIVNNVHTSFGFNLGKSGEMSHRFWNELCGTPNEEHSTARYECLKSRGFETIDHIDIKSSIPNVLNFTRTGNWEHIDWHTKLAKEAGVPRDIAKIFAMPGLFDKSKSALKVFNNYKWNTLKALRQYDSYLLNTHQMKLKSAEKTYKEIDRQIKEHPEVDEPKMRQLCELAVKYYSSEKPLKLFYLESNLYMKVWDRLDKLGYKCQLVFDSFYFNKPIKEETLINLIKEESIKLKKEINL